MNRYRITVFHVVFFIVIVGNIGGCLTAIGDPPLFLGYLKGVPFWWTLLRCWPAWLTAVAALVMVFYILDQGNFLKAPLTVRKKETEQESWNFGGLRNLIWLAVILAAVFIQHPAGLRELVMVAAAIASYTMTPRTIHEANDFSFEPIREVAWIFAGIFATMVPALEYIQAKSSGAGVLSATKLYWMTGGLSAFLDNAPTYLTFLAAAMGKHHLSLNNSAQVCQFAAEHPMELLSVSLGSVFFGAMTYIGNGPNFMVKSIADQQKVKTPSFLGYIFKFTLPFMVPMLFVIWWIFFR
jgi:Na+/H+ antiporter NhaD/arsenite permease-like protein